MKSILLDNDLHYLLRCVGISIDRKLNSIISEAIIDVADKYKIEVKQQLRTLYQIKDNP